MLRFIILVLAVFLVVFTAVFIDMIWLSISLGLIFGFFWLWGSKLSVFRLMRSKIWFSLTAYILAAFILAIWFRIFVVEIFTIPSSSMERTLFPGDKVMVIKLHYGPALPQSPFDVPWLNLFFLFSKSAKEKFEIEWWPYRRLKGFSRPGVNDVVVFRSVSKRHEYLVKRCVALPGDILEISNGQVWVNNKPLKEKETINQPYSLFFMNHSLPDSVMPHFQVFPYSHFFNWDINNFGPLLIPAKHQVLEINDSLIALYGNLLEYVTPISPFAISDTAKAGTDTLKHYGFKNNFFFMLGDHRYASIDSRYFGFIPEKNITGKAVLVLFNFSEGKFRHDRWFKKIK